MVLNLKIISVIWKKNIFLSGGEDGTISLENKKKGGAFKNQQSSRNRLLVGQHSFHIK